MVHCRGRKGKQLKHVGKIDKYTERVVHKGNLRAESTNIPQVPNGFKPVLKMP